MEGKKLYSKLRNYVGVSLIPTLFIVDTRTVGVLWSTGAADKPIKGKDIQLDIGASLSQTMLYNVYHSFNVITTLSLRYLVAPFI